MIYKEEQYPHLDEAWEKYKEQEAPIISFQTFYLERYHLAKEFITSNNNKSIFKSVDNSSFSFVEPDIFYYDGERLINSSDLNIDLTALRGIDSIYVTNCTITIKQMELFPIEIGDEDTSLREILNMLGLKCLDDDGTIFYNYNIIEK